MHDLPNLLAKETGEQTRVEHFFYFKKEQNLDACLLKLLALGFQVDSKADRNAGLPENTPWESEDDEAFNFTDYQLQVSLGKNPLGTPKKSKRPWSLIVSTIHSTEDLWPIHQALAALAESFGGTYDGHGYMME